MAQLNARLARLEDQKKQAAAQYSADIQTAKTTVNSLAEKYNSGFEYRMIECFVEYNEVEGTKRIFRSDNGEFVGEYDMNDEDWEKLPGLRDGEKMKTNKEEPKVADQEVTKNQDIEEAEILMLEEPKVA